MTDPVVSPNHHMFDWPGEALTMIPSHRPADESDREAGSGVMPFKSQAQRRKFAQLLVEGKISNETYEEWNRETGGKEAT